MQISPLPAIVAVSYLLIHSLYVSIARSHSGGRKRLLAVDVVLIVLFVVLAWMSVQSELWNYQPYRFVALWAPVIFFWWAYLWLPHTLHAFHPPDRSYDSLLIAAEDRFFRQPSLWLAMRDRPWLTDLMHLLYDSYFLYTFVLGAFLHRAGRIQEFQNMTGAVILGYAIAYSFFPFFPVCGPRWALVDAGLLPPERQVLRGSWFTRLTNRLMYGGVAHKACAMPSAHSSTAVVFAVWCWRIWGPAGGIPGTLIAVGMGVGAVYGRYHYVVDVLVGGCLGGLCVLLADLLI